MEMTFWIFVVFSFYSYVVFPLSLTVLAGIVRRSWDKRNVEPTVSMVISVYNEEKIVAQKIENALALYYPAEKLEIMVVSDGSTDDTENIVRGFSDARVVLKAYRERSGKTACLNRIVPEAQGEIVLFTDANSMFPRDILVNLVRNFADPEVGLVTGWTRYGDVDQGEDTTGIYSRFEMWTKVQESRVASCVGADGAVFALRKELFRTLREDDINDFVIPLNVIGRGKRVVMDSEVYCIERSADDAGKEYQRQVRITNRTLNAIRRNLEYFNPFRYGYFTYFLFSHKVMRFLVPFFLLGAFGSNMILLKASNVYNFTFGCQLAFYATALSGILGLTHGKISDIAKFFLVTIMAQLNAWFRTAAGISDTMWTPQR